MPGPLHRGSSEWTREVGGNYKRRIGTLAAAAPLLERRGAQIARVDGPGLLHGVEFVPPLFLRGRMEVARLLFERDAGVDGHGRGESDPIRIRGSCEIFIFMFC